jgi:replicative DNA helicase
MSKESLMNRMCAAEKSAPLEAIMAADFDNYGAHITSFIKDFHGRRFFINDRANMTMESIRSESKKIKHKHGLDLVIIDYLGLISADGKSQYEKVSHISRAVKLLAKELKIPVIVLAQLNRSVDDRADKKPLLSDLRDSGSIEQDADVVAFIYRESAYNEHVSEDMKNISELIVRKLRHGEPGSIPLITDFARSTFRPCAQLASGWNQTKPKKVSYGLQD